MKILDLFAGIGGFSLAAHWLGWETAAFCEIDPFCQGILRKNFNGVTVYSDVKKLSDFTKYKGEVDIITGGYPCQPFSMAGLRKGRDDPRHLWPNMLDIIKAVEPSWVIAENVYGHVNMGLDQVLHDLESLGYSARAVIIPAVARNAKHRRDRIWIIANKGPLVKHPVNGLVPPQIIGLSNILPTVKKEVKIDSRPARIKSLGNSIVPHIAYEILKAIAGVPAGRQPTEGAKAAFDMLSKSDILAPVIKAILYSRWSSDICDLKWTYKATPAGRLLFRLTPKLKPELKHTYGLMPTPRATEIWEPIERYRERMRNSPHIKNRGKTKPGNVSLAIQVPEKYIFMLPTPSAMEQQSRLAVGNSQSSKCISAKARRGELSPPAGALNPIFVEALMGYPPDWTKPQRRESPAPVGLDADI